MPGRASHLPGSARSGPSCCPRSHRRRGAFGRSSGGPAKKQYRNHPAFSRRFQGRDGTDAPELSTVARRMAQNLPRHATHMVLLRCGVCTGGRRDSKSIEVRAILHHDFRQALARMGCLPGMGAFPFCPVAKRHCWRRLGFTFIAYQRNNRAAQDRRADAPSPDSQH